MNNYEIMRQFPTGSQWRVHQTFSNHRSYTLTINAIFKNSEGFLVAEIEKTHKSPKRDISTYKDYCTVEYLLDLLEHNWMVRINEFL